MLHTFNYRIYPNVNQIKMIDKTLNMCRFLYNNALEQRIFAYRHRGVSLSYNKQAVELPQLKRELPEYKNVYSQVLQDVLRRLDRSFQNFFRRLGTKEKVRFPRFQGKFRYNSFTYRHS